MDVQRQNLGEAIYRLCLSLHQGEYVYYDEGYALLFIWNGSLTVNIWSVMADGIYECDVFMYMEKPTAEELRVSIVGYLDEVGGDDYDS